MLAQRTRVCTLLVPAVVLVLGACSELQGDRTAPEVAVVESGSPCPRPEPVAAAPGSVIKLTEAPSRCRIVFRETGIVLRSDPGGSHPDPGPSIVRDSRGRFYTAGATGFPFDIALWDTDGSFLRSFGGRGGGPGEMGSVGGLLLQIDSRDRLHVKDASRVWTVFEADHTVLRRSSSRALGEGAFLLGGDRILDDGRVIAAGSAISVDSSFHFRLVDSTGVVVNRFGPKDRDVYGSFLNTNRLIAYDGGDTFWAGPPTHNGHSPEGYTLEEWSVDGELLRTFRRDVPWFPISWPPPAPPIDHRPVAGKPSPPALTGLHMDDDGVLLAIVRTATDRWRDLSPLERIELPDEELAAMYESRIDAIDTRSGVVLASERLAGLDSRQVGALMLRSRFSAVAGEENLLPAVWILEYDLLTQ